MKKPMVPKAKDLILPTIIALLDLGGKAFVIQINKKIIENLAISDEVLKIKNTKYETEFEFQSGWARTYLMEYGAIDYNFQNMSWRLKIKPSEIEGLDIDEIIKYNEEKVNS